MSEVSVCTKKCLFYTLLGAMIFQAYLFVSVERMPSYEMGVWRLDEWLYGHSMHMPVTARSPIASKRNDVDIIALLGYINSTASRLFDPPYPNCLYLIEPSLSTMNSNEMFRVQWRQSLNDYWKHKISFRRASLRPNLKLLQDAVDLLERNTSLWPRLRRAIAEQGGLPPVLISWDPVDNATETCFHFAHDPQNRNVPIFRRLARQVDQQSVFLVPNSFTVQQVMAVPNWAKELPRETRRDMATVLVSDLTKLPEAMKTHNDILQIWNTSETVDDIGQYKAIVDLSIPTDFSIFCHGSVLLKVDPPECVDVLSITLRPWEHYIPIRSDLSNVVEMIKYALSNANKAQVDKIVGASAQWCERHLRYDYLVEAMLSSWTAYLEHLDRTHAEWPSIWQSEKHRFMAGHFLSTMDDAYSLPREVVHEIKRGMRADENATEHALGI